MNKLRAMKLFVRLSELGSFTAVADEVNATSSMVSKEIQKLEEDIGTRLLHRSTRRVQLTPIGKGYLLRCREVLLQLDDAEAFVQQAQNILQGKLRINLPMALGLAELGPVFADFMAAYPDIELDIHLGDENLDLIEHGFDLGFRASSRIFDSGYVGKPLKSFQYRICASPDYLNQYPNIETPQDLQNHNCFVYSYFKGGNEWPVAGGVRIKGSLKVNNTLFMRDIIVAGRGIGFLPGFIADEWISMGKLQEILPDFERPKLNLYALYPNRKHLPPILIKCIEFINDWFKQTTGQT
ncbi:MAG: LysR family transcriptional regulator [Aestuariibacter sp.]